MYSSTGSIGINHNNNKIHFTDIDHTIYADITQNFKCMNLTETQCHGLHMVASRIQNTLKQGHDPQGIINH